MQLDKLYQQFILDHNRTPRNFGPLPKATHRARGQDALCGDDIEIELEVRDGRVEQAAFSGEACAVTKASASMLTEWLRGRSSEEIRAGMQAFEQMMADPESPARPELGDLDRLRAVGHFPARVRNALLPWRTALKALAGGGQGAGVRG